MTKPTYYTSAWNGPGEYKRATELELHINGDPAFTRAFGKKVKEAGGRYTECRGHSSTRFVHVPLTHPVLINAIVTRFHGYKKTVVVARGGTGVPNFLTVYNVPNSDVDRAVAFVEVAYEADLADRAARGSRGDRYAGLTTDDSELRAYEAKKAHKVEVEAAEAWAKTARDNLVTTTMAWGAGKAKKADVEGCIAELANARSNIANLAEKAVRRGAA